MKRQIVLAMVMGLAGSSLGDVLILKNGQVITGTVLQRDSNGTLIKVEYGTFTYPDSLVKEVQKDEQPPGSTTAEMPEERDRIPRWGKIIIQLARHPWATELKQIPATVLEKGIFRNVPYMSFCAAYAYEVNIYGDPDHPAGLEIGIQHHLLSQNTAKSNCIEFVKSILPKQSDKETVAKLNWSKDKIVAEGLTFEIVPPTDADASGGWSVWIYNKDMLGKARASQAELREITEFKPPPSVQYKPLTAQSAGPGAGLKSSSSNTTWSPMDYSYAPSHPAGYSRRGGNPRGGGAVYVRGYYRKNGTYVPPHIRRVPRR